jgi:isovaleryl-CoA dehydrogenase
MRLGWTPQQRALSHHYEQLARQLVAPRSAQQNVARQLDRVAWGELAAEGLWRLAVPANRGGDGGTWWDFAAALEGIVRGSKDLGFCLSLIAHAGFVRALVRHGDERHRHHLDRLLAGAVGATALTEDRGGSDVARAATTAHPVDGGGHRLIGVKTHITNAPVADLIYVLGRMQGLPARADLTVFVVDRHRGGVRTGPPEEMLGNGSSPTGPISFDGAMLGPGDILGEPGQGLTLTYDTITLDRLLYGVVGSAYIEGLLEETIAFAQRRTAFRQPIADFQYVQRRITNMKLAVETTRWISYAALDRMVGEHRDASMMSSAAKLTGSESLAAAALDAMQIFGHAGYEEGEISRAVRDTLGTLIAGGTSDIQRKNIFTQLVKAGTAVPAPAPVSALPRLRAA